jgi:hypothetical protein
VSIAAHDHSTDTPVSTPALETDSAGSGQSQPQPDPLALADADYLGTLLDMFELIDPETRNAPAESTLETSTPPSDTPGQAFLNWVNDSKAKIHTVGGSVFLVTPGLFQRYAREFPGVSQGAAQQNEEWRWVQKQFEKMKVHRKRGNGLNIWACQVQGPRRTTILKGYLIEESKLLFESIPPDNPFLKIAEL